MGDVVGVHAGYEGGAAGIEPGVQGRNQSPRRRPKDPDPRVALRSPGQDSRGGVTGSIIYGHQFPIGKRLAEDGIQGRREEPLLITHREEYGNSRSFH